MTKLLVGRLLTGHFLKNVANIYLQEESGGVLPDGVARVVNATIALNSLLEV